MPVTAEMVSVSVEENTLEDFAKLQVDYDTFEVEQAAFAQVSDRDAEALGEVTDGNAMILPQDFWRGQQCTGLEEMPAV